MPPGMMRLHTSDTSDDETLRIHHRITTIRGCPINTSRRLRTKATKAEPPPPTASTLLATLHQLEAANAGSSYERVNVDSYSSRHSNLYLYENDGTNRQSMSEYLARQHHHSTSGRIPQSIPTSTPPLAEGARYRTAPGTPSSLPDLLSWTPGKGTKEGSTTMPAPALKLFRGVFVPCFNSIIGIIVFVRLGFIVGHAGISHSLLIGLLALTSTLVTTLSMSAIATNGKIRAGGAYYMISRSLGKELGGAVGILFFLGQVQNVSLLCLGTSEVAANHLLPRSLALSDELMSGRVYGTIILVAITALILFKPALVDHVELGVFACLCTALLSCLVGGFAAGRSGMPTGIHAFPTTSSANWPPAYAQPDAEGAISGYNFFSLLGLFFPFVTGILAGSARSGELRNAQYSIPRGTLLAHGSTALIYVLFILILGGTVDGPVLRMQYSNAGLVIANLAWPTPWLPLACCALAGIGIAAQTFIRAPMLLHALAKDEIIPLLRPLIPLSPLHDVPGARWWQRLLPEAWPHRCLLLSFLIAEATILGGNFDITASVVTLLYILMYLFVNLSTTLLAFLREPSWRPSWRYYNWPVSALGSILCLTYMFLISWIISFCSLVALGGLFFYISYSGAEVQWGDGFESLFRSLALRTLQRLEAEHPQSLDHVKSWKPQIIALVNMNEDCTGLKNESSLAFVAQLKKAGGLTILASVLEGSIPTMSAQVGRVVQLLEAAATKYRVRAFCEVLIAKSVPDGISSAIQSSGIGALRPNTVVLGYPETWTRHTHVGRVQAYIDIIRDVIAIDKALLLVKGLSNFPTTRQSGTIDVYWVLHDGGILTLLPFLLLKHSVWRHCTLRVFAIAQMDDNSVLMKRDLTMALQTLRIDAVCDVLELGDNLVDEFAIEKTVRMQERHSLLTRVRVTRKNSVHLINLPSVSAGSAGEATGPGTGTGAASDESLPTPRAGGGPGAGRRPTLRKGSFLGRNALFLGRQGRSASLSSTAEGQEEAIAMESGAVGGAGSTSEDEGSIRVHVIPPSPVRTEERTDASNHEAPPSGAPDATPVAVEVPSMLTAPVSASASSLALPTSAADLTGPPKSQLLRFLRGSGELVPLTAAAAAAAAGPDAPPSTKLSMMNTCVKLNNLMRKHSGPDSECRLIFSNLPAPGKANAPVNALEFMEYLDTLMDGLERVVLVKGNGMEVVTSFF